MSNYEFFDHTADVGLRVKSQTLPELFSFAALGMFDLMTDIQAMDQGPSSFKQTMDCHLRADNLGDLFLAWLRELLFTFSQKHLIFLRFNFKLLTEQELKTHNEGVLFDTRWHAQKCEVKAVTYHGFVLEKKDDLWLAEVVLDI